MATKAEIQNLINTNLASGSNIEAVDHRAVLNDVLDNLYGIVTTDKNEISGTTNNVVTSTDSDFQYRLSITKQGGLVYINGVLFNGINGGGAVPSSTIFFNITNPEYLMDTSLNSVSCLGISSDFNNVGIVRVSLANQQFQILDPIPNGTQVKFSLTYNTAN